MEVLTVGEFASLNGMDYQTAAGVIRFLTDHGLVEVKGKRAAKGGKGKPSTLYAIPELAFLKFKLKMDYAVAA